MEEKNARKFVIKIMMQKGEVDAGITSFSASQLEKLGSAFFKNNDWCERECCCLCLGFAKDKPFAAIYLSAPCIRSKEEGYCALMYGCLSAY